MRCKHALTTITKSNIIGESQEVLLSDPGFCMHRPVRFKAILSGIRAAYKEVTGANDDGELYFPGELCEPVPALPPLSIDSLRTQAIDGVWNDDGPTDEDLEIEDLGISDWGPPDEVDNVLERG